MRARTDAPVWLVPGTPEWARVWSALERELPRRGLRPSLSSVCPCCREEWQHMGGFRSEMTGWEAHDFRHRHHPDTGGRVNIRIRLRLYDHDRPTYRIVPGGIALTRGGDE